MNPLLQVLIKLGAAPTLESKFKEFTEDLRKEAPVVGGHKRIIIPKGIFDESALAHLGFIPVNIAVPETGQDTTTSWRHPDNLFHIHSHPGAWIMHEDRHPSSTMLTHKAEGVTDTVGAFLEGLPHVVTEGVPGMFNYGINQLRSGTPMLKTVLDKMQQEHSPYLTKLKEMGYGVPPALN